MPSVLISAILSSFLLVRLIKGPWLRYPQYLAVAMVGSGLAAIVAASFSPELADDFIAGNLIQFAGAYAGIQLFDRVVAG